MASAMSRKRLRKKKDMLIMPKGCDTQPSKMDVNDMCFFSLHKIGFNQLLLFYYIVDHTVPSLISGWWDQTLTQELLGGHAELFQTSKSSMIRFMKLLIHPDCQRKSFD